MKRLWLFAMLIAICVQSGAAPQAENSPEYGKLPIEEGAIPRDGFTLHYRTQGTGKPIVLLSGGPGLDIDYYLPVAKFFPPGYKLVFLEQRGTGRSRPEKLTAENITMRQSIEDLEALRSHLQLKRIILAGHSYGGQLAMAYAGAHPDQVDLLILIDSAGATHDYERWFDDNLQTRKDEKGYFFDPSKIAVKPTLDGLHQDTFDLIIADQAKGLDLRSQLARLRRPVLIIHGHQDPLGDKTAEDNHRLIKHSSLQYLSECGHFPWLEQPEEFGSILADFLAKNSPVAK